MYLKCGRTLRETRYQPGSPATSSTMIEAREAVVTELRRSLLLPQDDLLVVTREFINAGVSRAGLVHCLRRHGMSRLADLTLKEETADPEGLAKKPELFHKTGQESCRT